MTRRLVKLLTFLTALLLVVWLGYVSLGGWVLDQSLAAAAEADDLMQVRALLRSGAHADALIGHRRTPMVYLARAGYAPGVATLARRGVAVDEMSEAGNDWGTTPLMAAAESGDLPVMQALLAAGAVVDKEDELRNTALVHAILSGQAESVRFLIAHGAAANRRTDGWAPLERALSMDVRVQYPGSVFEVARALVEGGADVNATDEGGWTPAMVAATQGLPPFPGQEWEERDRQRALLLLIQHGANLNVREKKSKTVLRLAREYHQPAMVRILQDAGAKE